MDFRISIPYPDVATFLLSDTALVEEEAGGVATSGKSQSVALSNYYLQDRRIANFGLKIAIQTPEIRLLERAVSRPSGESNQRISWPMEFTGETPWSSGDGGKMA